MFKVSQELKEPPVPRDLLVHKDLLVFKASQELKEPLDPQALKE